MFLGQKSQNYFNLYLNNAGVERDKTMADFFLFTFPKMMHKITPSIDYKWLKRLNIQLDEPTNQLQ